MMGGQFIKSLTYKIFVSLFFFLVGCTSNQTRPTEIPNTILKTTNNTILLTEYEVRNTTNTAIKTVTQPVYLLQTDIYQTQDSYSNLVNTLNQYKNFRY